MKVTTEACLFGAWVIAKLKDSLPAKTEALDIGTGTGLLSLMLAQELPVVIDAVEIDDGAGQDAVSNFKASPFHERLHLHQGSIQEFNTPIKYPLIFSNPPFHANSLKADSSSKNLARHDDGLGVDEIFARLQALLAPHGSAALLYPASAADSLVSKAKQIGLNPWATALVHQTPAHEAFRVMHLFSALGSSSVIPANIFIKDDTGEYSTEFKKLLAPFYLKL